MINKDKSEAFEQRRDELEYLASFINHEAVKKITEQRDGINMVSKTSDEEFEKMIAEMSGREAPKLING